MNEVGPGVDHEAVRAPHALPAVFAVLGGASLAGCSHVIDAAIDAVSSGRGHHTWFVILHSPVTYLRVLILLGIATLVIISCAGWWLVGWMRWKRALRAAPPASGRDGASNPPERMRSRHRKHDRDGGER